MARAGLGAALLPMRRLVVGGAVGAVDRSLGLGRVEHARPLAIHRTTVAARAAIITELCTTFPVLRSISNKDAWQKFNSLFASVFER